MRECIEEIEEWQVSTISAELTKTSKVHGYSQKAMFLPLRLGLLGEQSGPSIYSIIHVLGKKVVLRRLDLLISSNSN